MGTTFSLPQIEQYATATTQDILSKNIVNAADTGFVAGAGALTSLHLLSPVTFGITSAIAGIATVLISMFHGANPLQVPASKIEQIFESAADDWYRAYGRLHMISGQSALNGLTAILQAGTQYFNQTAIPKYGIAAQKGLVNMTKVINDVIDHVNIGDQATAQFDLASIKNQYIKPNTIGWYPDSVTGGNKLADYLFNLYQQQLNSIATKATNAIENVTTGKNGKFLLGGAAGLILLKIGGIL